MGNRVKKELVGHLLPNDRRSNDRRTSANVWTLDRLGPPTSRDENSLVLTTLLGWRLQVTVQSPDSSGRPKGLSVGKKSTCVTLGVVGCIDSLIFFRSKGNSTRKKFRFL